MVARQIRKAMKGNELKVKDAKSCRLICEFIEPSEFFECSPVSDLEQFSSQFLNDQIWKPSADMPSQDHTLFEYLLQATCAKYGSPEAMSDFILELMRAVGFANCDSELFPDYKIPCDDGQTTPLYVATDISLV